MGCSSPILKALTVSGTTMKTETGYSTSEAGQKQTPGPYQNPRTCILFPASEFASRVTLGKSLSLFVKPGSRGRKSPRALLVQKSYESVPCST